MQKAISTSTRQTDLAMPANESTFEVPLTMSSREIADLTGKEHAHVMRDIRKMLVELGEAEEGYLQKWRHPQNGQAYGELHLNRELTDTLLTGYSAVLRRKVVARWHALEATAKKPASRLPQDYIEALEHLLGAKRAEKLAIEQRDQAIATKAEIGTRREATAMARASVAVREVNRLKVELGRAQTHATIIAVERATGRKFGTQGWRPLRKWCEAHGQAPQSVHDDRYGEVKAWPADAWGNVYGIDLGELFPMAE